MISVHRCVRYEEDMVRDALRQSVGEMGGWESYLQPGDTVLLKLNLVMNKRPEAAATTHPVFVKALIRLLQDFGCRVVLGDSSTQLPSAVSTEGRELRISRRRQELT